MPGEEEKEEELKLISTIDQGYFSDDSDDPKNDNYGKKYGKMSSKVIDQKKFPVHVSYDENDNPTLNIIPSEWRYPTDISTSKEYKNNNQGDHVIAYNLILHALSIVKEKDLQTLPVTLYRMCISILPEKEATFRTLLKDNNKIIYDLKIRRKQETTAQKMSGYDDIEETKTRLKKLEIQKIVQYVEIVADKFVTLLNIQKNESFHSKRKENVGPMVQNAIIQTLNTEKGKDATYDEFYGLLIKAIEAAFLIPKKKISTNPEIKKQTLSDPNIKAISLFIKTTFIQKADKKLDSLRKNNKAALTKSASKSLLKEIKIKISESIPDDFISDNGSYNVKADNLQNYISSITPLKKQSESKAVALLENEDSTNEQISNGFFQLFDYPKVGNEALDDTKVLFESIAKLTVLIFNSFEHIKNKPEADKKTILNEFLNKFLDLQLWSTHEVDGKPLTSEIIISKLQEVSVIDFKNNNFSMLSERQKIGLEKIDLVKFSLKSYEADEGKADEIIKELESNSRLQKILNENFTTGQLKICSSANKTNLEKAQSLDKLNDTLNKEFLGTMISEYLFNPCRDVTIDDITDIVNTLSSYNESMQEGIKNSAIKKITTEKNKFNKSISSKPENAIIEANAYTLGTLAKLSIGTQI